MTDLRLVKCRERGQEWLSATWGVDSIPGLTLSRSWHSKPPGWQFGFCFRKDDETNQILDEYLPARRIQKKLHGQCFPTRREAMQALEVMLMLEEDTKG